MTDKTKVIAAVRQFRHVELLRQAEEFAGEELSKAVLEIPPGCMVDYAQRTTALLEALEAENISE